MAKLLPNSISGPFLEWLERGGHKITLKKDLMVITKDGKRGAIPFERHRAKEFYQLDEYLAQRYELFLTQYFKYGKDFIHDLRLGIGKSPSSIPPTAQYF